MTMRFSDHIAEAEACLRAAGRDLSDEISAYPTPISGCDAQFNHLLAERARVSDALAALGSSPFVPTPRLPGPSDRVESR